MKAGQFSAEGARGGVECVLEKSDTRFSGKMQAVDIRAMGIGIFLVARHGFAGRLQQDFPWALPVE